jgi:hypothetical protein
MSKKEELLYPDIKDWFNKYLEEKYRGYSVTTTYRTSRISLDSYLKTLDIEVKEAIGLKLKIDIVGVLKRKDSIKLAFVEVKDKPLTLADLGQLWGYTELIGPVESFLVSPGGLGSLEFILKILKREDLLVFGQKKEKMISVSKWDIIRKTIDYSTLIPKL